ncbi:MAG: DNA gyrase inhibitor YacG [Geobacteraceae bacterium]
MAELQQIRCPQCGKPAKWEGNPSRPFCSARCSTIDLGAWANEEYRIVGGKTTSGDEDAEDA